MTAREIFEYALIELNKVEAPSLLLEDYNYFINKAVYQYVNKMYNLYDLNQQKTDDLRVLKATSIIEAAPVTEPGAFGERIYKFNLPNDYLHLLNCIVQYTVKKTFKCYEASDLINFGARRLTADMYSQIINNYYMRPMYKRPYYFLNNVTPEDSSNVTLEIRYGKDDKVFTLKSILVDYLKTPTKINLTQDQVDQTEDTSQVLEFPDYVCQEIINELVKLLMENASDPRLQSNIPVNQTIAPPPQAQQQSGGKR